MVVTKSIVPYVGIGVPFAANNLVVLSGLRSGYIDLGNAETSLPVSTRNSICVISSFTRSLLRRIFVWLSRVAVSATVPNVSFPTSFPFVVYRRNVCILSYNFLLCLYGCNEKCKFHHEQNISAVFFL